MSIFSEPKAPSYSAAKTTGTRTLRADFGDGYSQRAGDGLNGVFINADLEWSGMTVAEADTVEAFFAARAGFESFDYTLPREGSARKFICSEWARRALGPQNDTITATFEEVFDL